MGLPSGLLKSPFSLVSLSARKLFEVRSQFNEFARLPRHLRKLLAVKITKIFTEDASEFLQELITLEEAVREPLNARVGKIGLQLSYVLDLWIRDIRRSCCNLARLQSQLEPDSGIQNPEIHLLMHYAECHRWIKEGNLPEFIREAKRGNTGPARIVRLRYYLGEVYFGLRMEDET